MSKKRVNIQTDEKLCECGARLRDGVCWQPECMKPVVDSLEVRQGFQPEEEFVSPIKKTITVNAKFVIGKKIQPIADESLLSRDWESTEDNEAWKFL